MLKIYFVEKELGCFNKTNERYDYIKARLIIESLVSLATRLLHKNCVRANHDCNKNRELFFFLSISVLE